MALRQRVRNMAVVGATALALSITIIPAGSAPAAASPTPAVAATASAPSAVHLADRKKRSSRSARSFAVRSNRVMSKGNSLKGVPYRRGGSTPRGFDCSGYTSYVYRTVGLRLPHSATAQMRKARKISRRSARPGDLVFFRSGGRAYHVGIYAGGNRVLHSPRPGKRVQTAPIWTRNVTFGRVL